MAVLASVAGGMASCAGAPRSTLEGASIRPLATGLAAPAPCGGCHAAIADEWRVSFHRLAFTDETFQHSLALEDPKEHVFCTGCHAPAASRLGVAVGVDCEACHGVTPHARDGARARPGPAATCAGCHEFTFAGGREELVQRTVSEHARSAFADVPCAGCHMPTRAGHKDHRFLAGHAPERISAAVRVEAERVQGAAAIRFVLRVDAGHDFPTGDMFRRARLLVFAEGARGEIVGDASRTFGRTWTALREGSHAEARTEARDTRIRGTWTGVVSLGEPGAPIARARWQLLYERVLAVRGDQVTVVSSDAVAEGTVAWR